MFERGNRLSGLYGRRLMPTSGEPPTVVSPLVATCGSFREAKRTVDELCGSGVPRQALTVVAEGLTAVSEGLDGYQRSTVRTGSESGALVGAALGFAWGLSQGSTFAAITIAVVGLLYGAVSGWAFVMVRRWLFDGGDQEHVVARRYYVITDQQHARRARQLMIVLRDVPATPCVGSLPVRVQDRTSGPVTRTETLALAARLCRETVAMTLVLVGLVVAAASGLIDVVALAGLLVVALAIAGGIVAGCAAVKELVTGGSDFRLTKAQHATLMDDRDTPSPCDDQLSVHRQGASPDRR